MEWLNVRRPQGRDTAAAALFAVLYFAAMWLARHHGWYPKDDTLWRAELAGIAVVAVLLTRERWPLSTLFVAVVGYPLTYGSYMTMEFHALPVLLATYTVAAKGRLRSLPLLLLAVAAVTRLLIPFGDLLSLTGDEREFWWLNVSRFTLVEAFAPMVVLLGRAAYRHRLVTGQLMARNRELERLRSVEADQMVNAERTRIARELHDVVAHHISAVVIRAQAADRVADSRPGAPREAVRWIADHGQQTLAAMRHVVRVLRSTETGGSLAPQATLAELPGIASRMAAVGLPVDLRLPAVVPALPAAVELATVRIIQEALTNVLVHAKASKAVVEIQLRADGLRIDVHDNGSADSPPTAPIRMLAAAAVATVSSVARPTARAGPQVLPESATAMGGNGLLGMRERAASCGGGLTIGTSPELGGWLVTATLRTEIAAFPVTAPGAAPASAALTVETVAP